VVLTADEEAVRVRDARVHLGNVPHAVAPIAQTADNWLIYALVCKKVHAAFSTMG
jgi:hypothetical protein